MEPTIRERCGLRPTKSSGTPPRPACLGLRVRVLRDPRRVAVLRSPRAWSRRRGARRRGVAMAAGPVQARSATTGRSGPARDRPNGRRLRRGPDHRREHAKVGRPRNGLLPHAQDDAGDAGGRLRGARPGDGARGWLEGAAGRAAAGADRAREVEGVSGLAVDVRGDAARGPPAEVGRPRRGAGPGGARGGRRRGLPRQRVSQSADRRRGHGAAPARRAQRRDRARRRAGHGGRGEPPRAGRGARRSRESTERGVSPRAPPGGLTPSRASPPCF